MKSFVLVLAVLLASAGLSRACDPFVGQAFFAQPFVAQQFIASPFVAQTFVAQPFFASAFVATPFVQSSFVVQRQFVQRVRPQVIRQRTVTRIR